MEDSPSQIDVEGLLSQSAWITALVRGLVRDPNTADDIVQETWLRALRRGPDAREVMSLRRWVSTVARRIAGHWAQSEAARHRREHAVAKPEAANVDPEVYAERVRLQREVASHLLGLDEPYRTAVILRYQDGLRPGEIATRLGISDAAARQRVSRGLARLRARLEAEHGRGPDWRAAFAPLLAAPVPRGAPMTAGTGISLGRTAVWIGAVAATAAAVWLVVDIAWREGPIPVPSAAAGGPGDRAATDTPDGVAPRPPAARVVATPLPGRLARVDRDRDLHGRVVDPQGQPVPGASTEVLHPGTSPYRMPEFDGDDGPRLVVRTETNSAGEFSVPLTAPRLVDLRVSAPHFARELLVDRCPGERVEVRLHRPATLSGCALGRDGKAVAGARVRFVQIWLTDGVARELFSGTTGADGGFRIADLPPCRGSLEIAGAAEADFATVLDLVEGAVVERQFTLDPGVIARGLVVDAATGQVIPGAKVAAGRAYTLMPQTGTAPTPEVVGHGWRSRSPVIADAGGAFSVVVPVGFSHAQVYARADGYGARAIILSQAGETDRLRIELTRQRSCAGRLVSADRAPIPGARVVAVAVELRDGFQRGDWCQARTGADGRFTITGLGGDLPYVLRAWHPDWGLHAWVPDSTMPGAGEGELGAIVLQPPASVGGVVTGPGETPIAGAYLSLVDPLGVVKRTRTDDLGRFLCAGLGPATYRVSVGERATDLDLVLAPGEQRRDLHVQLAAAPELTGTVTDVHGDPILNAHVMLVSDDDASVPPGRFVTRGDGRFRFPPVPDGRYTLQVAPNSIHLEGGNRLVHAVRMAGIEPGPGDVRVILPPAAVTRGTVVDRDGRPRQNVLVFARDGDGGLLTYEYTDASGQFLLRLPPQARVGLAVGKEDPKNVLLRDVPAGAQGLRIECGGR